MNTLTYTHKNQAIGKLMQSLFSDVLPDSRGSIDSQTCIEPDCELVESDNLYLLNLEIPGVPKDKIKIEAKGQELTISAERTQYQEVKPVGMKYSELKFGKIRRTFNLPIGTDSSKIEAVYEDGVLKLQVPKSEFSKTHEIKIGQKSNSSFIDRLVKGDKEEKKMVS